MCWIIPLIVGLLSAFLGYLLGKCRSDNSTQVFMKMSNENNALCMQLKDCQSQKVKAPSEEEIKQHALYQDLSRKNNELQNEIEKNSEQSTIISELRAENLRIRHSLETCEKNLESAKSSRSDDENSYDNGVASNIAAFAAGAVAHNAFDADTAKAVFGKKIKENDLTVVEGIGPKIAELFNQADIHTWSELAQTSVEDCQKILDNAGDRFTIHNPGTWPRQAKLAADGEWQKLFDWQEKLDGGKE